MQFAAAATPRPAGRAESAGPDPQQSVETRSGRAAGSVSVFGESSWVRATVALFYLVTAVGFIRVLQRLTVPGIGLEDTPVWTSAFRVVLRGNGANVYDPATQIESMRPWISVATPDRAPLWAFPPIHTFVMSPLGLLSPLQFYAVLTVVSALLWCRTARSLMRWVATRPVPWSRDATALVGATTVGFTPAMGSIRYGSFSVLVLAALWTGIRRTLLDDATQQTGALATALMWASAALKPQMIVFIMIAALRRRTREVVGAGLIVGVASLVIAIVVRPSLRPSMLAGWVRVNVAIGTEAPGAAINRMWTVRGVLTNLLGAQSHVVTGLSAMALVSGLGLLVWLGWRSVTPARLASTFAVALCLQCTVFPYQSSYDAVLLVPSAVLAIDAGRRYAPRMCTLIGGVSVASTLLVFSPAWEEQLPGLTWKVSLPAMIVWIVSALVIGSALVVHHEEVLRLDDGSFDPDGAL